MSSHHHVHSYAAQTVAFLIWFVPMLFTLSVLFVGRFIEGPIRRRRRPEFRPVIVARRTQTLSSENAA